MDFPEQQPRPGQQPTAGESLADRLNRLFELVHPPDRGPYLNNEVAAELAKRGGPTVSGTYIWQLRKGERDNPTKRHLEALAGFFGVPVSYFFDDAAAQEVVGELELLRQMRDSGVQRVALRALGLSPKSMEAVLATIDHIRELEGLPKGDEQPGGHSQSEA